MHEHHTPAPRKFSLAQQGVGVRLAIGLALVTVVGAMILPLVVR